AGMARPELADDPHYASHSARGEHQVELDGLIAGWTATLDADRVLGALEGGAVPAGGIYRAADMLADPHYQARQAIVRLADPELGEIAMQDVAPRLSRPPRQS